MEFCKSTPHIPVNILPGCGMLIYNMPNIDISISNSDHDKLEQFCSLFNSKTLIKKENCRTKTHKSINELILTRKSLSFQSSSVIETGLSDHHKLTALFVKPHGTRLDSKAV